MAEGEFHEAMNLAALWNVPVLFCCENNRYAMGTSLQSSESQVDLALKAASYAIPAWSVDGMDVMEVHRATTKALVGDPRGRRPDVHRVPDVPVPRALDVRSRSVPRSRRGRAMEAARSDHHVRRSTRRRRRDHRRRARSDVGRCPRRDRGCGRCRRRGPDRVGRHAARPRHPPRRSPQTQVPPAVAGDQVSGDHDEIDEVWP